MITRATRPDKPRKRWTVRTMAREVGILPDSVHRISQANDIKPHLIETFKLSNDPSFEEKFWDVIGLYLDPPERALVLCCDEKCQCQALERTQPGLPLGIGHIRTKTHHYTRHGTVTLFAALNYLDGTLIARTEERRTHVEWLRFLWRLRDLNGDGDWWDFAADDWDPGEQDVFVTFPGGRPGGIEVGPSGEVFVTRTANGVGSVYVVRPLTTDSDGDGVDDDVDNCPAVANPGRRTSTATGRATPATRTTTATARSTPTTCAPARPPARWSSPTPAARSRSSRPARARGRTTASTSRRWPAPPSSSSSSA